MPVVEGSAERTGAGAKLAIIHESPDSHEVRALVAALEVGNYHCAIVDSGAEALARFEPSLLGAAIVSLGVAEDALDVARSLKREAGPRVFLPVIVMGSPERVAASVERFSGSCDDFMTTPLSTSELLFRLEALIERQGAQAELESVNQELKREQERRRALAALVVHDLRNPLSAIVGNVHLLEEALEGSAEPMVLQCLADLSELSAKTLSMVGGLLDVEEFEGGLLQSQPEDVDVHAFVSRLPAFYKTATEARKLTLDVSCPEGMEASFDRQLIGRIVENLLDNSVRYAPRKGRVALRVAAESDALVIEVGNNGPPIPAAERERMFERYYRLEGRRPGARANRGLGLYFCRLAAEAHKGTILVTETPSLPACFRLTLPAAVVRAPGEVERPPPPSAAVPSPAPPP